VWAYRLLLALGIPLVFLAGLEGGLRIAGFGRASTFLIPDAKPGYLRTNPDFASLFLPGNFDLRPLNFRITAHKAPNTVRIVVLGESAAQGVPVPSFAFAPQLRAQLRARYPGREFEVINTGIVAINSHVVYQVAREMARYEPDLFLVYAGNNEVVGPYGPGCAYLSQMPPLWVIRASVFVRSTRTGQLLGSLAAKLARGVHRPAEWGGMSMFVDNAVRGDDPRLAAVYANFGANLRGIVDAASGAGAKTVLCTVVGNLKDCPPFLSLHRPGLSQQDLAAWTAAFDSGRLAWRLGDAALARTRLTEAQGLDPQYAETLYMLGAIDLKSGDEAAARGHFIEALHWDALRFRPDPEIGRVIRQVARERAGAVTLLDAAEALGSDPASSQPLSGREILFEHVHFDWGGNYRLGMMMARACGLALYGQAPGDTGWLDNAACARALAYTAHERLPMLLRIDVLVRKPPFTNQLTHVGDEARMAREIEAASGEARSPEALSEAASAATEALAGDPDNPALAGILEGIRQDQGDLGAALALARRAGEHLPGDYALAADEASLLVRLGRYDEAQRILTESSRTGADLDLLAPVFVQLWTQTRRFGEGLAYLGNALQRRPSDLRLRSVRAGLLRASGDEAGAEREFRAILAADPTSEDALESLVGILEQSGRHEKAARMSVAAAGGQPRNQANSLRAAQACEALGDKEGELQNMLAAERSGPVTATFELTLALKLYKMGRAYAMMEHLAEARSLSMFEGNPAVTESIGALVGRMRGETRLPQ
jgi:tetratricopeptide (TPR) repeat protein